MEFQESGVEPQGAERESPRRRDEQMREAVEETIATKGYAVLHKMFVERIMNAQSRLSSFSLSEPELRYEQGRFNALRDLQSSFVSLSKAAEGENVKEEEYER
jgi:hypothetical protein